VENALDAVHGAVERSGVAEVAFQAIERQPFERLQIAVAANQDTNRMACGDKLPGDMASDEACGAGYERGHKMRKTSEALIIIPFT
jgi:hypothetical protein